MVKNLPAVPESWVQLGQKDPLEKGTTTHSSSLAWKIPWMEEPGHEVAKSRTRLRDSTFTFHFHSLRRKWQPTPVFLPGESQGQGSLVGCCLWGCTESDTTEATQQHRYHNIKLRSLGTFLLRSGTRQRCFLLSLVFKIVLKVLTRSLRQVTKKHTY